MTRVVLVEDQTLVREGLKSLLALAGVEVAGEAASGDTALAAIDDARPDVVLLDLRMPGMSGLDVLKALSARGAPFPPVLILTTFDDDAILLEAIRAGARGYLLKDVTLEQLRDAIERLARGERFLQPAVTRRVMQGLEGLPRDFEQFDRPDPLTEREVEVLRLMAGGYSNRELAEALHVAEGTVKNHISSILGKMGVRDRTRAVLKALAEGIIG